MVNFKKLADRAKDVVEKRGGPEALKADAKELGDIAKGKGSFKEKAARAKDAVADQGKRGRDAGSSPEPQDDGPAGPREAASPGPAVPGTEDPPITPPVSSSGPRQKREPEGGTPPPGK